MKIHPRLKSVIYGLSVFAIFMSVCLILKIFTHRVTPEDIYFGLLSNKDILIGLSIAVLLTFIHEQKKRLK